VAPIWRVQVMHALRTAAGTATGAGFLDDPDYIYRGARSAAAPARRVLFPADFGRSAPVNGFIK
jgi:hypothetical protein